ncbi:hypothetical protein Rsub_00828 [Raphidocelis subcapitata]|uniref:Uncharacterized protein n=1 Tax=Raphidocelis subcapitata TaxID=307507 RepID=A0A2V0NL50_9CHLO|nr:hypothetical protein Rsub_00828 [Raphidocelis subcapitata]|eukprot:GBF88116.1 hypothetical protein Rsub_00828 [Raphidocelis subcapitata]
MEAVEAAGAACDGREPHDQAGPAPPALEAKGGAAATTAAAGAAPPPAIQVEFLDEAMRDAPALSDESPHLSPTKRARTDAAAGSPRADSPAAAPPRAAAGDAAGDAPGAAHKRHLESAGGSSDEDSQMDAAAHAAKRPAASGGAAEGRSVSRSPSRGLLSSVFAQAQAQAAIPSGELAAPTPEPQQPHQGQPHSGDQQQQQQQKPPPLQQQQQTQQPGPGSGPQPAPPPGMPPLAPARPGGQQQQEQQAGERRLGHSFSSGLPPCAMDAMPSSASLQGWLSTGSPHAGSPLKQQPTDGSGSFKRWIRSENSTGSFTLPTVFGSASSVAESLELEDSLQMDIKLLPPVVPEEVPPEEAGEDAFAAAAARQWERRRAWREEQRRQHGAAALAAAAAGGGGGAAAAGIAAGERAFHFKIAGWEDELLGMMQAQMAPITIRAVVQAFKDRIHTERDKAEFKALCDKYTVVVEFPVSSGVKCLALKAWLQGAEPQ